MKLNEGYSSSVKIVVRFGNATFDVAQVTDEVMILRDDPGFDLTGDATLIVTVDGKVMEHDVMLFRVSPEVTRNTLSYW